MSASRVTKGSLAALALFLVLPGRVATQEGPQPVNSGANPYRVVRDWAQLTLEKRPWGGSNGVAVARDGRSVWAVDRCSPGTAPGCVGTKANPVHLFDETGREVRSFGGGMFAWPHGIHVDRDGNVWITDGQDNAPRPAPAAGGAGGAGAAAAPREQPTGPNPAATKGHQVFKFSPKGQLLMTIGKPGGATGEGQCCWQPNDVITNDKGEIFIAEGHGQNPNDRIMKFTKDGKFVQAWGTRGTGPMQFNQPHGLAFDSKGNLYVGDRANNRVLVLDKDMKQIHDWPQFSRPSGVYIDKHDMLYSADSESGSINPAHGDWKRGIRIGSVKDGKVTAFIPDPLPTCQRGTQPGNPPTCGGGTWVAEGVAVDADGNVYGAEVGPRKLTKYVKKK